VKPLVSILIPAYNAQEWLADTLRSAIAQTWDQKEIIIVDDGSKDQTLSVARRFESPFVKVFTQENQGAAAARNKAFSLSQGDFIQWLDADDLLAPDKVSRQMEAAQTSPNEKVLLSGGWGRFMYRYDRAKFVPTALWCDLSPVDWLMRKMGQNIYMQTGSWLVSRKLTEMAGPWDVRLLGDDDGEYFCRVLLASERVRFIPESKIFYRASGSNSLSYIGGSDKKRDAQWLSMKLHIGYIRSLEDSERVRAACVKFLQNWMVFFYPERPDLVEQANELAKSLGGKVKAPRLSWKYAWIKPIFGPRIARRAQLSLPNLRWSFVRSWDKTLFRLQNQRYSAENRVLRVE
jgi:glycosyltransferase involved in cell wall biosynthesis